MSVWYGMIPHRQRIVSCWYSKPFWCSSVRSTAVLNPRQNEEGFFTQKSAAKDADGQFVRSGAGRSGPVHDHGLSPKAKLKDWRGD
jgi:hypothetical protein